MSTDAGTPPAPDAPDAPPPAAPPGRRRDLRDGPVGRIVLLVVVLVAALLVARTCGSHDRQISKDEALEIATENAGFTPCEERGCVMIRAIQRGLPTRLVWIVGLAEDLDAHGRPTRFRNFVIDAATGEITRG